jgi:hypothetical protein
MTFPPTPRISHDKTHPRLWDTIHQSVYSTYTYPIPSRNTLSSTAPRVLAPEPTFLLGKRHTALNTHDTRETQYPSFGPRSRYRSDAYIPHCPLRLSVCGSLASVRWGKARSRGIRVFWVCCEGAWSGQVWLGDPWKASQGKRSCVGHLELLVVETWEI